MTCKVFDIIDSVINALLPTSIFWEMKQNEKQQNTSHMFAGHPIRVLFLWVQNWKTWTVLIFEKQNTWQQIESQAKRMCLDRLHRLVKNKYLFAVESIAFEIFPRSIR